MHFKVKHKNLAKGDIDNEGIILLDAEGIDFKQGKIKEISINSTDEREMVYIYLNPCSLRPKLSTTR
jgi:hypothetical protein